MTKRRVATGDLHTCFVALDFFRQTGYKLTLSRTSGKWALYILLP